MWVAGEEALQEEKLLWRVGVVPGQTWQRRCDSCPETKSESGNVGVEEEGEAALPPSELLETHLTEI